MLNKNLSSEEYGPYIDFKESSFLENPDVPGYITNSRMTIE